MGGNVFIASAEPQSGKSVAVLGMMDLLSRCTRSLAFFRPVIPCAEPRDPYIHLVARRYGLEVPYRAMYGCTEDEAQTLIASGKLDELQERILEKYTALESRHDRVLCAGTDFTGAGSALEFEFNIELANSLGCILLPVINGHGKSITRMAPSVGYLMDTLTERGDEPLAVVVNRVAPAQLEEVRTALRGRAHRHVPAYALSEHPRLGMPTVGGIARALGATWVSGEEGGFGREVLEVKVAAMELPHFLRHLNEGSLLITPGDRADILLGSLLAHASAAYPQVAGILLTGGLEPAPEIRRLMDGLSPAPVPVLSVATDTYTTAMNVSRIRGAVVPEDERKIAAALGIWEAGVNTSELERRLAVTRPARVSPVMFEYELIRRARQQRQHIVLPEGDDERILRASEILTLRGVVHITLLGEPDRLRERIAHLGLSLDPVEIVDPASSRLRTDYGQAYYELRRHKGISKEMAYDLMADATYYGTMMVQHGHVDGMVSGATHTTQHTIRPAFEIIRTAPGYSVASSVFFMCLEDRVLVYGDCAVNPNPNAEQLAHIAIGSAATARMFGIEPRVAMLSYSTGESGKGKDVEKVREATALARKLMPELAIEGPIQYDAAIDMSVAQSKLPDSAVAGHATVLIFPDLNTGNNTYKAVQRSANAVAVGPILQGLNKPVNDLSRGCTVKDIVNTVAITAIQSQADRGQS
jgi:phosphate acetyltransferase